MHLLDEAAGRDFKLKHQSHLKHLKLKGMQPKTNDAYSRALRRIGARFKFRIDDLSEKATHRLLHRAAPVPLLECRQARPPCARPGASSQFEFPTERA
jgi:hypothetical protein